MPQPTTPNPVTVDSSVAGWHNTVNANFEEIRQHLINPLPLKQASSTAGLPSPASFDRCIALADFGGRPQLFISNGAAWKSPSSDALSETQSYVLCSERQNINVSEGSIVAGSWVDRTFNQEESDVLSLATFSSGSISLAAGRWRAYITVPHYFVDYAVARLFNSTLGELLRGSVVSSPFNNSGELPALAPSIIEGEFVLSATTVLKIQSWVLTSRANDGRGKATNISSNEWYSRAEFWRIRT